MKSLLRPHAADMRLQNTVHSAMLSSGLQSMLVNMSTSKLTKYLCLYVN